MNIIFFAFLFFLPAGVANMVPVFAAKLFPKWDMALDFGLTFRGKSILGNHKTIRGLISGIFLGILFALFLSFLFPQLYQTKAIFIGFLLSFGALLGDSIKSFFKRQVGIASGKSWFPFDQIDYILGGMLFSLLAIRLSLLDYFTIFIVYFLLHLFVSWIGFLVGLKKAAL